MQLLQGAEAKSYPDGAALSSIGKGMEIQFPNYDSLCFNLLLSASNRRVILLAGLRPFWQTTPQRTLRSDIHSYL